MKYNLGMFKFKESSPSIQPDPKDQGGVQTKFWFWGADRMHNILKTKDTNPKAKESTETPIAETQDSHTDILQMISENPSMAASTFYNLIKSKGYKISKEADASGAFTQNLRAQENKKISFQLRSCRFKESAAVDNGIGPTRFKTILIQEGMGNFKDAYFYSKEALASAVSVFEGKKIYADHPSEIEEQSRPERSVRDVLGHFENIKLEEGDDKQTMLVGDVVILPDNDFRWARSLMKHAVEYSSKYPDKEFVGLSINASGDAKEMPLKTILESDIPETAKLKLQKASSDGIETVRMVYQISEAVSCDLVTEAGAGGKVIEILESNRNEV